jgi:hypothetical protein
MILNASCYLTFQRASVIVRFTSDTSSAVFGHQLLGQKSPCFRPPTMLMYTCPQCAPPGAESRQLPRYACARAADGYTLCPNRQGAQNPHPIIVRTFTAANWRDCTNPNRSRCPIVIQTSFGHLAICGRRGPPSRKLSRHWLSRSFALPHLAKMTPCLGTGSTTTPA